MPNLVRSSSGQREKSAMSRPSPEGRAKLDETRGHTNLDETCNHPTTPMRSVHPATQSWYPTLKIVFDWTFAAILLVVAAPFMAVAALLVKLTSRGPAFYSQVRLGLNGKPFRIYKVRTMTHNCESQSGAQWATAGDPRITFIGRILRATHLDELPQLWNVLRGDMSMVGPRPERPEFVPNLEKAIAHYADRLDVRPGVTGLAQVQLPADTDINSVRRKLAYDLYYIRHMGFWLDLKLIVCTALHVVFVPYHILGMLFNLPGQKRIEKAYQERLAGQGSSILLGPAPAA
jgi:lipopolysaccharide/colanic/teichoic acid biosynthesis glycosyltransferase